MHKSEGMSNMMLWMLGLLVLVGVGLKVGTWLLVVAMAYGMIGFPVMRWRSRVSRTNKFIASTRKYGVPLVAPPEMNADFVRDLAGARSQAQRTDQRPRARASGR